MSNDDLDDIAKVVGPQISELFANIIISNIQRFVEICKAHNVEESKLSAAITQYTMEAKVNGVKIPKAKGLKSKSGKAILGDPTRYLSIKSNDGALTNNRITRTRAVNVIKDKCTRIDDMECYATEERLGDTTLLSDINGLIIMAYNINDLSIVRFSDDDKRYLMNEGYKLSPYA